MIQRPAPRAGEDQPSALGQVHEDRYKASHDPEYLRRAKGRLTEAINEKSLYLPARYWLAVVNTALGDSKAAVDGFRHILDVAESIRRPLPQQSRFLMEIHYNLGLAYYQQATSQAEGETRQSLLQQAESYSRKAIPSEDRRLASLAHAALAQTYVLQLQGVLSESEAALKRKQALEHREEAIKYSKGIDRQIVDEIKRIADDVQMKTALSADMLGTKKEVGLAEKAARKLHSLTASVNLRTILKRLGLRQKGR